WATPGTDVLCAGYPDAIAVLMIHSAWTPPPSPPKAQTSRVVGRNEALSCMMSSLGWLQRTREPAPHAMQHLFVPTRVLHDFSPIEGRAQRGGMGVFAA